MIKAFKHIVVIVAAIIYTVSCNSTDTAPCSDKPVYLHDTLYIVKQSDLISKQYEAYRDSITTVIRKAKSKAVTIVNRIDTIYLDRAELYTIIDSLDAALAAAQLLINDTSQVAAYRQLLRDAQTDYEALAALYAAQTDTLMRTRADYNKAKKRLNRRTTTIISAASALITSIIAKI